MSLFITEIDKDGNPIRTDPYTPPTPGPAYVTGGNRVTAQQQAANPLYFILGVALIVTAAAVATLTLYNQGKLDPAIAWLEARGIDVAPLVELVEDTPPPAPLEIPEGVIQPLPQPTTPPAPPAAPGAAGLASAIENNLTPQEHTPFYTWEVPAIDPASDPATWPAMTEEQRAAFLEANPDWSDRVAEARAASEQAAAPPPVVEAPAVVEEPQAEAPPAAPILTYPTPVPAAARGPIRNGQAYGSGPAPRAPQPAAVPDSPSNPSYTAPTGIQPAQPFYEYSAPPEAPQTAPEPPQAPAPSNPSYVAPTGIQAAPKPGCLLEPACAASLGQ